MRRQRTGGVTARTGDSNLEARQLGGDVVQAAAAVPRPSSDSDEAAAISRSFPDKFPGASLDLFL